MTAKIYTETNSAAFLPSLSLVPSGILKQSLLCNSKVPFLKTKFYYIFIYAFSVHVGGECMCHGSCGGQRTSCRNHFPPSSTWILGTELRYSDLLVTPSPPPHTHLSHQTSPRVSLCSYKHIKSKVVFSCFHTESPLFCTCFSSMRTSLD